MATTSYGTPYVVSADLVSGYPGTSLSLADRVDDISFKGNGLNDQTGTTYTLDILDAGKTVTLSNASPVTVTIPTNTAEAIEVGSMIRFYNKGAGAVTIQPGGGVTLEGGNIIVGQYGSRTVVKTATNTWAPIDTTGKWTSFTPTLTASTTNPTLGTGSGAVGGYSIWGKTVFYRFNIQFGTSGTNAGSGTYRISVPVNSNQPSSPQGSIFLFDSSTGNGLVAGTMFVETSATWIDIFYQSGTTTYAQVGSAGPWAWAASDQIRGTIIYEAA